MSLCQAFDMALDRDVWFAEYVTDDFHGSVAL
jgi:hypothetical protein